MIFVSAKKMDLKAILSENLSRNKVDYLVNSVLDDSALFEELYALSLLPEKKIAWHAAWVLSHASEQKPSLFEGRVEELIKQTLTTPFDGVRRSFLYIISFCDARNYSVDFINACFDWMLSPKQAIAIQVYAMRILLNVCRSMPDFKQELQLCLENANPADYSKGFASCRRNALKALSKMPS